MLIHTVIEANARHHDSSSNTPVTTSGLSKPPTALWPRTPPHRGETGHSSDDDRRSSISSTSQTPHHSSTPRDWPRVPNRTRPRIEVPDWMRPVFIDLDATKSTPSPPTPKSDNWKKVTPRAVTNRLQRMQRMERNPLDDLLLIPPITGFSRLTKKLEAERTKIERMWIFLGYQDYDGRYYETMHPASPFVSLWQLMQTVFLLYIAIFLPFRIAFEGEMECEPGVIKFDLFLDIFFILDVALQFLVGFKKLGQIETEKKIVVRNYLYGMFAFDFVISIPVAWVQYVWAGLELCLEGSTSAFHAARLLRLLRLVRVLRAVKLFSGTLLEKLPIGNSGLQVVKLLSVSLFVSHLTACAFWFVKSLNPDHENYEFYVTQRLLDTHIGDKYIISLYFVATMISTVGFGDVHGGNTNERIFCTIAMLVGAGVFATVISSISALVANSSTKLQLQQRKLRDLNEFVFLHKVPKAITKKLRMYYTNNFQMDREMSSMEWIRQLPVVVKSELCTFLAAGILGECELFKGAPPDFVSAVFLSLRHYKVSAGETIIQAGQRGSELFVIYKGLVKYYYPKNAGFELLKPGELFGENALLSDNDEIRPVTVVAAEDTELYIIEKYDLIDAIRPYSRMRDRFENFVLQRMETIHRKLEQNEFESQGVHKRVSSFVGALLGKFKSKTLTSNRSSPLNSVKSAVSSLPMSAAITASTTQLSYKIPSETAFSTIKPTSPPAVENIPNGVSPSASPRYFTMCPTPTSRMIPAKSAITRSPSQGRPVLEDYLDTISKPPLPPPIVIDEGQGIGTLFEAVGEAGHLCRSINASLTVMKLQDTYRKIAELQVMGSGGDPTEEPNEIRYQHAIHVLNSMQRLEQLVVKLNEATGPKVL